MAQVRQQDCALSADGQAKLRSMCDHLGRARILAEQCVSCGMDVRAETALLLSLEQRCAALQQTFQAGRPVK